jgi:nucleoside-diphosphate-sugar epimerase
MRNCIIFGGSGFIGTHFVKYIIDERYVESVIIADIVPSKLTTDPGYQNFISYVFCDVRKKISIANSGPINLVVNLAAIHREPGHRPIEYFETNILGAENVCEYVRNIGSSTVVFMSSISPYGSSVIEKDENSLPTPESPYGCSKLVAEKTYQIWQHENNQRKLIIVRPGVVFGPGEGGNVTRMGRALKRGYFFYIGNRQVRKAGGYVKELVRSMVWALKRDFSGIFLYNFSFPEAPSVEEYVNAFCEVLIIRKRVKTVPFPVLYFLSFLILGISKIFRISQPIHPVRLKKMIRPNLIQPKTLMENNYLFRYTLRSAIADWIKEQPSDFI